MFRDLFPVGILRIHAFSLAVSPKTCCDPYMLRHPTTNYAFITMQHRLATAKQFFAPGKRPYTAKRHT